MKLASFDVHFVFNTAPVPLQANHVVTCSPQEAFTLVTMPSFSGLVTKLVPNYSFGDPDELSEMPEE